MIDVEPTAQVINAAAQRMFQAANKLCKIADAMRDTNDLNYASEAISEILNAIQNLGVDLLVSRPIRALEISALQVERQLEK